MKKKVKQETNGQEQKTDGELEKLKQQGQDLENKFKRALADYQNLEKRVTQERSDWIKTANKGLLARLLPVLDTLMMASTHVEDQGLKLSIQQFQDGLKAEGVERIETVGKSFDPRLMECTETVMIDPSGEMGVDEDKVIEEVRPGYTLYGNVLRPAQVKVRKSNV